MFVAPIGQIVEKYGARYHQYADDTQIYTSIHPADPHPFNSLSVCAEAVTRWFLDNGLLINPSKTEAVVFGTRQQVLTKIDKSAGISFAGSQIKLNDSLMPVFMNVDQSRSEN